MTYEVTQGCGGQLTTIGLAILVVVPVSQSPIENRWRSFSDKATIVKEILCSLTPG